MQPEALPSARPPVCALLRRPAVLVTHEVMTSLHDAGFEDVLPAHLGVFQYPGPDGQRPGVLASRAQISKQSMNHLLKQLETAGYLTRHPYPGDQRRRIVRLTERGWAAWNVIWQTTAGIEREWSEALGDNAYSGLAVALDQLNDIIETQTRDDAAGRRRRA